MLFLVLLSASFVGCFSQVQDPIPLSVHNWTQMLTGDWMLEFYASWCPACKLVAPEWQHFAQESAKFGLKVATIDCSNEPAVAMIFTITALPTIFHIKDGVFREVKGRRKFDELEKFIINREYELIEPTEWSYSPNAFYMPALVRFLNLGLSINTAHRALTSYGVPASLALVIVGTGVLASGAAMGMLILCVCEYFCPPRPQILNVVGMEGEPPEPLITKENDNEEDSVLDDSEETAEGDDYGGTEEEEDRSRGSPSRESSSSSAALRQRRSEKK